ncbi:putative phiE125 gp8 family phage protein [Paraburkholderia sp. UCT70]|uniref:head-tail connector protein n=1 Tax=Paraburkholderia sp. UCT70 TaxID=2991068 RepID=UPI003D1F5811
MSTPDYPEPVTLALAKAHCRIDTTDEDELIEQVYIPAGRETAEQYTGRTIRAVPGSETVTRHLFADGRGFVLADFPAFDLESLKVVNDDTETVLDIDEYGARIVNGEMNATLVTNKPLPAAEAFYASYTAGYASGTVPANLVLAMLELTADAYENREAQSSATAMQRNPRTVALLDPFRITFGL